MTNEEQDMYLLEIRTARIQGAIVGILGSCLFFGLIVWVGFTIGG